MSVGGRMVAVVWAGIVAIVLATFLIPVPAGGLQPDEFRGALASSALYAGLHVGAAALFLLTLNIYRPRLRRAYWAIVAGVVLLALGVTQFPVINAFGWQDSLWYSRGLVGTPFILAGVLSYLGARALARLVGVSSPLASLKVVVPVALTVVGLSTQLPHVPMTLAEQFVDMRQGVMAWNMTYFLMAALLVWRVRHSIGEHYKTAMVWLFVGFLGCVLTAVVILGHSMLDAFNGFSPIREISNMLTGILLMGAGYAFMKTKEY